MLRGMWILKTLVGKEFLRYRRVWGPLVLVGALVVLAAVMSSSSKTNALPGAAGGGGAKVCTIYFDSGSRPLVDVLKRSVEDGRGEVGGVKVEFRGQALSRGAPMLDPTHMAIEIRKKDGRHRVHYWLLSDGQDYGYNLRNWFTSHARKFLHADGGFDETTAAARPKVDTSDAVAMMITVLLVFCMYLTSFSLYVSSMAEERERRVLLAILMTPASPGMVVAAKVFFHLGLSAVSVAALAWAYKPELVVDPTLWLTVLFGSVSYLSIATVLFCVVQRFATLNSVPMLYLVVSCTIILLASMLPPMVFVQRFLTDGYLMRLFQLVTSGQDNGQRMNNLVSLGILTVVWQFVALYLFSRYAHQMCKGR